MNTQKDKFEKMFEEALREHEMPYDGQAWNAMNNKIVKQGLRNSGYSAGLVAAATIGVLITVAASVFLLQDDSSQNIVSVDVPTVASTESTANVNGGMDQNNFDPNNNNVATGNETNNNQEDTSLSEKDKESTTEDKRDEIHKLQQDDSSLTADNTDNTNGSDSDIDPLNGVDNKDENETKQPLTSNNDDIPVNIDVHSSAFEVCKGNAIAFSAQGSSEFTYEWIVDNKRITGKEVTIPFNTSGNSEVALEVYNNDKIVYNESISIMVHKAIDAEIVVTPPANKTFPQYEFELDKSNQVKSIQWEVESTQSVDATVQHLFRKKGNYIVTAEIKDFNGCKTKIHSDIAIKDDYNLYAANAIDLNSSDYKRKTFMPAALEVMNVPFEMMIYNRSNKLLYETSNVNQPWTGIDINTNQIVSTGAYVWVVKLKNKEGKEEVYYGSVTVVK